jgi:phosphopantothenoylcysteine decarboxylase/phosphopantothenate--cysteine ligase
MYRHPAVIENLAKLREWGVGIVDPKVDEGKAKIADGDEIILHCERALMGTALKGKKILITSGSCREPVDDIRILTTRSTGQIGRALALQAFRLGADVTVVHRDTFPCIHNVFTETADDMRRAVHRCFSEKGADIYISAAAISDFAPEQVKGKIPSGSPVNLVLKPLPKLLAEIMERYRPTIIAFKLGDSSGKMAEMMIEQGAAMVLVNETETMGSARGAYMLLTKEGRYPIRGSKDEVAAGIWNEFLHPGSSSG